MKGQDAGGFEHIGVNISPRNLNQNSVAALFLDRRLLGPQFVNTAPHNFQRLVNGVFGTLGDALRGQGHADSIPAHILDLDIRF